jgi:GntP family gluconate:H+ symporter
LATSLYAVHCLVPPHPGITAAAGVLKADLGKSMLLGTLLAIPPTIVAFVWVKIQTKNLPHTTLPPVESLGLDTETLPNPWASFLPIIVPILLIALKSIFLLQPAAYPPVVLTFIKTLGEPIVALLVGIMLTMRLCKPLNSWVINAFWESAIEKSGPILAIIAMGGAFGEIIKNMDIGKVLGSSLGGSNLGLWIPFLLTAVFKTAQGSSTVAIISTAAIVEPLLSALGLDSETGRLLALMAMGAGSMAISHVNDAYFWVISKFGIVDTQNTLKIYSTASIWMSITTFLFVWLASFIL